MLFFPGFSLAGGSVQSAAVFHIASVMFITSLKIIARKSLFRVGFEPTSTSMD